METTSNTRASLQGVLCFLFAVVTLVSVAMIGLTSFTNFNPPDWVRIASMAPLPFALIASVGFGLAGYKKESNRAWAKAGLVLVVVSVVAFGVMIAVGG